MRWMESVVKARRGRKAEDIVLRVNAMSS